MLDHKPWGSVVFVSSESGAYIPKEMVHYGFLKSAQLVIARGAAETTKGTNVTVNSVMPGPTWVEMAPVRLAARAEAAGTTVDDSPRACSQSAGRPRCCGATPRRKRSPT
jgi:NAD(P)-dependent dehydrogenase (short-subunit alcohol dehydrogenase family)